MFAASRGQLFIDFNVGNLSERRDLSTCLGQDCVAQRIHRTKQKGTETKKQGTIMIEQQKEKEIAAYELVDERASTSGQAWAPSGESACKHKLTRRTMRTCCDTGHRIEGNNNLHSWTQEK